MKRAVWFVAGAGVGVYAMIRGRRAAEAFTAEGLRMRVAAFGAGARVLREELVEGKAEKENELRQRYSAAYHRSIDQQSTHDQIGSRQVPEIEKDGQ
ncbi:MAG: DUF6167 family protein [Nocardioides sp.]|uniref:DUF6167 family protein n=1 Tax=Nocardioides sp. TaxID=35761 RepID=UPI0039E60C95